MAKARTSQQDEEKRGDDGTRDRPKPDAAIRTGVLAALGRPPELLRVAVSRLWGDHYRVNVLTGPDPASVRIAHSYFVRATDDGDIVAATPSIVKLYQ